MHRTAYLLVGEPLQPALPQVVLLDGGGEGETAAVTSSICFALFAFNCAIKKCLPVTIRVTVLEKWGDSAGFHQGPYLGQLIQSHVLHLPLAWHIKRISELVEDFGSWRPQPCVAEDTGLYLPVPLSLSARVLSARA